MVLIFLPFHVLLSCEGCKELQTEVDRLKQQIGELQQQLLQQRAPEKRASDAVDSVQPLSSGMFSKQQVRVLTSDNKTYKGTNHYHNYGLSTFN